MSRNFIYTLIITGVVVGLLLSWQINTKIPLVASFPADEVEAKQDLLQDFLNEQAYLKSRIVFLRKEIEDLQDSTDLQTEKINFEVLENLKKNIGLTQESGPGLEIVLDDNKLADRMAGEISDFNLVQASDLRDIANLLNAASASAISINNQRVIATSTISAVGTTILVNNSHIAPPFVITAVGDSDLMLQRILNKDLLPELYERMKKFGVFFEIHRKGNITVPIYNADLKVDHLNLVQK